MRPNSLLNLNLRRYRVKDGKSIIIQKSQECSDYGKTGYERLNNFTVFFNF